MLDVPGESRRAGEYGKAAEWEGLVESASGASVFGRVSLVDILDLVHAVSHPLCFCGHALNVSPVACRVSSAPATSQAYRTHTCAAGRVQAD
jgi:hypothetical protein